MRSLFIFLLLMLASLGFAQKTSSVQPKTDPKEKEYMSIEEYERKNNPPVPRDSVKIADTINVSKLTIFTISEVEPEFPGGKEAMYDFIKKNLKFPEGALGNTVYLKLLIYETGDIIQIQILKGAQSCSECDKEAIRVVKLMPKWNPGKMSGKPVNHFFSLPIRFKL